MSDNTCPVPGCNTEIPDPGMSTMTGIGDPPAFQPAKQRSRCPSCGTPVIRMKDPGPGHAWQRDEATEAREA